MCYRHELWKDYENSEYTGNRNFTKTWNGPERKFRKYKKKNFKTAIKSFESCGYFWVGRLTANNQYFNLGLTVMYIQGKFWYFSYSVF